MWLALCVLLAFGGDTAEPFTAGKEKKEGFFDLYWDAKAGKLYLAIERFDEPFLFVNSLATGLGSNDIGLDRGQLGDSRVVSFRRIGQRVFLVQPNLDYRADSENPLERRAVAESFAYSTLWGAAIAAEEDGAVFVDLADFAFRDEHGVARRLERQKEGSFRLNKGRSHYYPPRIKAFPDNTEIETALTFTGAPAGQYARTVTPTANAFTLHQRYSLVRLPDEGYRPRRFHAKSGGFVMRYRDYAAPLDQPLDQRFVYRHRLQVKDPDAAVSEAIEPVVYHVDAGAPPRIQKALVEGASWWAQAFEAAGIRNGFRVEIMPPDADPMDVRYNVIQWVHRSTRGWSYGGSVRDPRTGEIIKGHVTLGSLRIRQDRLLFEGMIPRDEDGGYPDGLDPVELALARIRQLSAHEVGHTLGLVHNFAASGENRASVMDYPAPLVELADGKLDFSQVYGVGVGAWDKAAIRYLYGHFRDEQAGLAQTIRDAEAQGLLMIADQDSRAVQTMHPASHMWDNGADAVAEFSRTLALRDHLINHFGPRNLPRDVPLSSMENWLVPIYLHHRYQLEACGKSVGGAFYDYGFNDGGARFERVAADRQREALNLILSTLDPAFLDLPASLRNLIPPRAYGHPADREAFASRTWPAFDEMALPETAARMSLDVLLAPERVNRLYNQYADDPSQLGVAELADRLLGATCLAEPPTGHRARATHRLAGGQTARHLLTLAGDKRLREDARAQIWAALRRLGETLAEKEPPSEAYAAHYLWLQAMIKNAGGKEQAFTASDKLNPPPGSPIGQPAPFCSESGR